MEDGGVDTDDRVKAVDKIPRVAQVLEVKEALGLVKTHPINPMGEGSLNEVSEVLGDGSVMVVHVAGVTGRDVANERTA